MPLVFCEVLELMRPSDHCSSHDEYIYVILNWIIHAQIERWYINELE